MLAPGVYVIKERSYSAVLNPGVRSSTFQFVRKRTCRRINLSVVCSCHMQVFTTQTITLETCI